MFLRSLIIETIHEVFFYNYRDSTGQPLYYTVQLVNLFRANPGERWVTEEGIQIDQIHKIEADKCKKAEAGDKIYQQYVLRLEDNTLVDSSYSRNAPFVFRLRNRVSFFSY